MRRAGTGLIVAAVLALAGCKSTDKDDKTPGGSIGKSKDGTPAKGPTWLDDVGKLPGAGTGIPKGTGLGPNDPGFDPKIAAQDAIGGRVLDPDGRPARNIFIRIEKAGVHAPQGGAGLGIYTKPDGYFSASGFQPGQTYELTAEATTQDGRKLTGVVQTKVPNAILLIVLRDDLAPGGVLPPAPKLTDTTPPKDGAWGPGGPATGVPPPTIGGTPKPPAGTSAIPPPADIGFPPPPAGVPNERPENVADKNDPFKPPPANIPNPYAPPPVPPLTPLPPMFGPPGGGGSSGTSTTTGAGAKLALVDTLDRPWGLDAVKPGSLVLLEFATSTCKYCPSAIPALKDLQSRYGASGLQVVGVMCDELPQRDRSAMAAKYRADHNLNYALFVESGAAGTVRDQYGVNAYPHALLLNSAGKVLWRGDPRHKSQLESAIKQNLAK